jgi:rRNA large subunit m3Psi methyltransferase RlmH
MNMPSVFRPSWRWNWWKFRSIPVARTLTWRALSVRKAKPCWPRSGRTSAIVTLEVHGKPWSTEQLAVELDRWRLDSRTVNFMVGGPEGLAPEVCARADQRWSLSPLTLPHPLVRILIGEQLYRAWTVLSGHPYHK